MLSSAVLFAFVNGGATVVSAVVGAVVYNEKITLKSACGILIGIVAMICMHHKFQFNPRSIFAYNLFGTSMYSLTCLMCFNLSYFIEFCYPTGRFSAL